MTEIPLCTVGLKLTVSCFQINNHETTPLKSQVCFLRSIEQLFQLPLFFHINIKALCHD